MKTRTSVWAVLAIGLIMPAVLAQKNARPPEAEPTHKYKQIYYVPRHAQPSREAAALVRQQSMSGQTIPIWSYSTQAYDGKTYSGTMVGRSPFAHGHRPTTIPTYIVPVVLTFQDSGETFDPTTSDSCSPDGASSVLSLILNSPLFLPTPFTMNGVNVGTTQYLDAFQRAAFWSKVGGTPYHTQFSNTPTVLPSVKVTVPTQYGVTQSSYGYCHDFGMMDVNWWDNYVETTIIPALASKGVGPANFPQLVLNSVAEYLNGDTTQCCALGYHNSFMNNGVFQTYSVNEYDNSGAFGNDTSTMSHEIAEWMDDPDTSNPTPAWGAEGQVQAGSCQANLEVGDPLSPGFSTPTSPIYVTNNTTGVQYTLQELAFYSWFMGNSPSLGAGGLYSDNGTFTGSAKACPDGGSN